MQARHHSEDTGGPKPPPVAPERLADSPIRQMVLSLNVLGLEIVWSLTAGRGNKTAVPDTLSFPVNTWFWVFAGFLKTAWVPAKWLK